MRIISVCTQLGKLYPCSMHMEPFSLQPTKYYINDCTNLALTNTHVKKNPVHFGYFSGAQIIRHVFKSILIHKTTKYTHI